MSAGTPVSIPDVVATSKTLQIVSLYAEIAYRFIDVRYLKAIPPKIWHLYCPLVAVYKFDMLLSVPLPLIPSSVQSACAPCGNIS